MVKAIENELGDLKHVTVSWGCIDVTQKLASLHTQLRAGKQLARAGKSSTDAEGAEDSSGGGIGASGVQAIKSAAFIDTRKKVKEVMDGNPTFTRVLDLLSGSDCKMWRTLGLGKLKKAAGVIEIESVSKLTGHRNKHWTICLATEADGITVNKEAQGVAQSDENTYALLSGRWGSDVNWIEVLSCMEE